MKTCLILVLVVALALVEAARIRRDDEKYTARYDDINVDDIIKNKRLTDNYVKCLLGTGNCTPEGAELKKNLADALQNDCAKCTDKQKERSDQVIKHFCTENQDSWKQIQEHFDPQKTFYNKNKERLGCP